MDLTKAFTYVFEDKEWMMKMLIGGLLSIVSFFIIPIFILGGYSLKIMRNVKKGVDQPLPEWDEWGDLLKDGFSVALIQFVYTLPILIIMCIAFATTGGLASFEDLSDEALGAAMAGTFGIVGCLFLIYFIAMIFITPAIRIQYVKHNDLSAGFRFSEIIAIIRENIMDILLITGVMMGVGFAFALVNTVLAVIPCIGQIISFVLSIAFGPYFGMVNGHMMGQLAHKVETNAASA